MQYKRSCFNTTLARHTRRRFWPLPVLIFLFFLVTMVLPYYTEMTRIASDRIDVLAHAETVVSYAGSTHETEAQWFQRVSRYNVYDYAVLMVIVQAVTALFSGLLVMHHIHGRKQIQFYHGLPLSRRCVYTTHVIMGIFMGLVPVLLSEAILGIIALCFGAELFPVLQLMGVTLSVFLIFYSLAVLAGVLAGQTFGAVCLYGGLHCAVAAVSLGGAGIMGYILPGFGEGILLEDLTIALTPMAKLYDYASPLITDIGLGIPYGFSLWGFVGYGIAGAAILALTYFLYQIRPGEAAGEMIAFPVIRLICKILVSLMVGLGGAVVVITLWNPASDLPAALILTLAALLMILGWAGAEMVIRKTFRVFGKTSVFQCLSLTAVVLLLLTGARMDLFGYVNRVPEEADFSAAALTTSGASNVELEMQDAIAIHQVILDNSDDLSNVTGYLTNYNHVRLQYWNEADEKVMNRTYYVKDGSPIIEALFSLLEQPEYCIQTWFDHVVDAESVIEAQIYSGYQTGETVDGEYKETPWLSVPSTQMDGGWRNLTQEQGQQLYEAVQKDIAQGNAPPRVYFNEILAPTSYGTLEFRYYLEPYASRFGTPAQYTEQAGTGYESVNIYQTMTNTLAVLEEIGYGLNPEAFQ